MIKRILLHSKQHRTRFARARSGKRERVRRRRRYLTPFRAEWDYKDPFERVTVVGRCAFVPRAILQRAVRVPRAI